jgi:selenocysteine lyase/cysteine desulfurase
VDEATPDERLAAWRADTPGCAHGAHLNNAGAGLMPAPVMAAIQAHLERESLGGGYEAADAAASAIAAVYDDVARLLGTRARNVALTGSATEAYNQALASFDWNAGDVLVTTRHDYASNQLTFLALARRRGVELRRAPDLPTGGVDPQALRALARHPRCRLVALTWMPTNSGLVQPAAEVGAVCAELGVPYLVDACQALGQVPIDVAALRCDYLAATARKFLRGPRGVGCLFVSDERLAAGAHPWNVDLRGATWTSADSFTLQPDARRFENWEFPYALVLGLGAAARYALTVGLEVACRRARLLAEYARTRLAALPGASVLDRGVERSAIVTAAFAGHGAPSLVQRLRERGLRTGASPRAYALLDMQDKQVEHVLRISPHYYNTHDEVDALGDALEELLR